MAELRNQIEAILYSVGKKIDVMEIMRIVEDDNKAKIKRLLVGLQKWYDENSPTLMVIDDGDSWKLTVREKYLSVVRQIVTDTELTRAVMETLSVIAWKAPVMQSDIVGIRGSSAYDHIADMVDSGFVTKERLGRSYILKLTQKFFNNFDLDGKKYIKEVFKEIKSKGPEQLKVDEFEVTHKPVKLGKLEVFDESEASEEQPEESKPEQLGDLEVVDESDSGAQEATPDQENMDSTDDNESSEIFDSETDDDSTENQNEESIDQSETSDKNPEGEGSDESSNQGRSDTSDEKKDVEDERALDNTELGNGTQTDPHIGESEDVVTSENDFDDEIVKEHTLSPELEQVLEEQDGKKTANQEKPDNI